jgi:translation initiation factor 2B subunit (eIF-2B alpha/beta/delta family)
LARGRPSLFGGACNGAAPRVQGLDGYTWASRSALVWRSLRAAATMYLAPHPLQYTEQLPVTVMHLRKRERLKQLMNEREKNAKTASKKAAKDIHSQRMRTLKESEVLTISILLSFYVLRVLRQLRFRDNSLRII